MHLNLLDPAELSLGAAERILDRQRYAGVEGSLLMAHLADD
jgi:hypothetical protein